MHAYHLEFRFVPAVLLGGVVSFALFLLMHQLIATDGRTAASAPPQWPAVASVHVQHESRPPPVTEHVPSRPRTPPRPPGGWSLPQSSDSPGPGGLPTGPRMVIGNPEIPLPPNGDGIGGNGVAGAGDAPPLVKFAIKPLYPPAAEYRGIEGTVRTCYTVAADGSVTAVRVAGASSPAARQAFSQAAVRTVMQWKYVPAKRDGRAVATPDVCQSIEFTLKR